VKTTAKFASRRSIEKRYARNVRAPQRRPDQNDLKPEECRSARNDEVVAPGGRGIANATTRALLRGSVHQVRMAGRADETGEYGVPDSNPRSADHAAWAGGGGPCVDC